jgi:hypothetical protein
MELGRFPGANVHYMVASPHSSIANPKGVLLQLSFIKQNLNSGIPL